MKRTPRLESVVRLLPFVAFPLALAACSADRSTPASGAPSPAKPSSQAAATTPAAPKSAATEATTGAVELPDGNKKKVGYAIELPKGLKDVSEVPYIKEYAKAAKASDGYTFEVMAAKPALAALKLDAALALLMQDPDAVKNKAKILDKGTTDDGYYFAYSIHEGKKSAVIVMAVKKKGDVSLQCRGNAEGPLANKPDEAQRTIVGACKTLKITTT
jgi:hypothetical protein